MTRKTRKTRKTRPHKKYARKRKGGTRTAHQRKNGGAGCLDCFSSSETNNEKAAREANEARAAREAARAARDAARAAREAEREAGRAKVEAARAEVEASKNKSKFDQIEAEKRLHEEEHQYFRLISEPRMVMNEL
jgi:hypothetical protein